MLCFMMSLKRSFGPTIVVKSLINYIWSPRSGFVKIFVDMLNITVLGYMGHKELTSLL